MRVMCASLQCLALRIQWRGCSRLQGTSGALLADHRRGLARGANPVMDTHSDSFHPSGSFETQNLASGRGSIRSRETDGAIENPEGNGQRDHSVSDEARSNGPARDRHETHRRSNQKFSDRFGTLGSFGSKLQPYRYRSFWKRESPAIRDSKWDTSRRTDLDVSTVEHRRFEAKKEKVIPTISVPLAWSKAKRKKLERREKALREYREHYGVDPQKATLTIECARKEFNHYEGMRYPMADFPLVSAHWDNNKYKDDWFVIKPTGKNPSFDDKLTTGWEEFADLLDMTVIDNIIDAGIKRPTVIQEKSFRTFRSDDHLFLAAETGSGKTLAFAAPMLSLLLKDHKDGKKSKALVLVLSKELRSQAKSMIESLSKGTGLVICEELKRTPRPSTNSLDSLKTDPPSLSGNSGTSEKEWDVLVTTPGVAARIFKAGELEAGDRIAHLVIDEADSLLDDSFVDSMKDVLANIPVRYSPTSAHCEDGARVVFVSASCPDELRELAEGVVDAERLRYVTTENLHALMPHVLQKFIRVREMDKVEKLVELISKDLCKGTGQTIVFCKDNKTLQFLCANFRTRNIESVAIGGEVKRTDAAELTKSNVRLILATDLASRGLDLPMLHHVINYDFPRHMVDYLHRVGRVGRAGSRIASQVTSFVRCPWEVKLVNAIEYAARLNTTVANVEANIPGILAKRREGMND